MAPSWDVPWREIDPTLKVSGNNTFVSSHSLCPSKSAENPLVIHKVPLHDVIIGVCVCVYTMTATGITGPPCFYEAII